MTTTLTGKNQITLPAELVKELGLVPGSKIEWSKGRDGSIKGRKKMTRLEAAKKLQGMGAKWLKPGDDMVALLLKIRREDDRLMRAKGYA
jgi:bifunctional DNA-binding transcriptional regulator/antitoxin component of YhaV-PrlF toxin-antitoxin module